MPLLTVVCGPPGKDLKPMICAVSAKSEVAPRVFDAEAETKAWISRAATNTTASTFAGWGLRYDRMEKFLKEQSYLAENLMDLASLGKHARPVRAAILGVLCDLALETVVKSDALLVGSFTSAERGAIVAAFEKKFSAKKTAEILAGAHARDAAETLSKRVVAGLEKVVAGRDVVRASELEDLVWELQVASEAADHAVRSAEHAETAYMHGHGANAVDAENELKATIQETERVQPAKKFTTTAARGYSYYGRGGYGYQGYGYEDYGRQQPKRAADPYVPEAESAKLKIVLKAAADQTRVFANTAARSSNTGGAYSSDAVDAGKMARDMLLSSRDLAASLFAHLKGESGIEQARQLMNAAESLMTQSGGNPDEDDEVAFKERMTQMVAAHDEEDLDPDLNFSDSSDEDEDVPPVAPVAPPKPSVPALAFVEVLSGPITAGYVTIDSIDPSAAGKSATKSLLDAVEVLDEAGRPKMVDRHRYAIIDGPRVIHNYPRDSDVNHLTSTDPCELRAVETRRDDKTGDTWTKVQADLNPSAARSYNRSYGSRYDDSYGSYY